MAKLTNPEPLPLELQREFDALRSKENLRALTDEEDGSGSERLPSGVYGFTYSPCSDNFPLFKDRDLRSFETHKLSDGNLVLLGFLSNDEKELLSSPTASTLHLFAEPKGDVNHLVQIPLRRIRSHVENSQRGDSGLAIEVVAED